MHISATKPPVPLGDVSKQEADDGIRTRDTWLGKPVLYQLSYVRAAITIASAKGEAAAAQPLPRPGILD